MSEMTGKLVKACEGLEEWHLYNYGVRHTAQKGSNERHLSAKRGQEGEELLRCCHVKAQENSLSTTEK